MSATDRPYRVTVVCHGNICRSPMAEFLLREAFEDAGLGDRVAVDSAGTSSEELGNGAHPRTLATLRRHGHRDVGWSAHRARQFRAEDFDTGLSSRLSDSRSSGTAVAIVQPKTPAARAGLQAGDIIVAVNGSPVASASELGRALDGAGKSVQVDVARADQRLTLTIGRVPGH